MIDGNVIRFGYGDVGVSGVCNHLILRELKKPFKCGESLIGKNPKFTHEPIDICCRYEDCDKFLKFIEAVEKGELTSFDFRGYTLDFSEYNNASIDICRDTMIFIQRNLLMCSAV